MKNIPIKEMTKDQVLEYIRSIYGQDVETEFDKECMASIEINLENGKANSFQVYYSKIKVTPKNAPAIYWPIGLQLEDINPDYALKLIKELL